MSKNRYFLICRDRITNKVKPIAFSYDDFISQRKGKEKSENALCDIDLYTTSFRSRGALIIYLYHKGLIDSYDTDIYIVSRNGDNLNTMECVFGDNYFRREIRNVASKKRISQFDYASIHAIFNNFARRMFNDDDFYSFVVYGYSSIYPKFVNYFKNCHDVSGMLNCKLRDGAWAINSYHLIRNIVEAYSKFESRRMMRRGDSTKKDRDAVADEVMIFTEPGFIAGQVSLFDSFGNISNEDYILSNLCKLDVEAFRTDNGVMFNSSFFPKYEDKAFAHELVSLLDSEMMPLLFNIARDYSLIDSTESKEVRTRLERDKAILLKKIRENPILEKRVYSFILLYNKCMRDNGMGNEDGYSKRIRDKH